MTHYPKICCETSRGECPLSHRYPFDRLLIAQVREEDLNVIAADRIIQSYNVRLL
jgi:PIN domain nuclease of toxin-antitoxin system